MFFVYAMKVLRVLITMHNTSVKANVIVADVYT